MHACSSTGRVGEVGDPDIGWKPSVVVDLASVVPGQVNLLNAELVSAERFHQVLFQIFGGEGPPRPPVGRELNTDVHCHPPNLARWCKFCSLPQHFPVLCRQTRLGERLTFRPVLRH